MKFIIALLCAASACFSASAATSIDKMSSLKALPPGAYLNVELSGYYSVGDGGGGPLYWSGASTATPDSCTIYKPNSNPTKGRWIRRYQNPLPAAACGIKGDGVTNDAARIQAAVNYSNSSSGTEITLKPGTFYVGSQLEMKTGSRLNGAGDSLTFIKTDFGDTLFNFAENIYNASISNLGITAVANASGYKAFVISGDRITLSNITVKNMQVGIWGANTSRYVTVKGYRQFSDSSYSTYGMHLMGVNDWLIEDVDMLGKNFLYTGIDKGITFDNGRTIYGCKNVRVKGARFSRMRAYGMGGDPDDTHPNWPTTTTAVATWIEVFQDSDYVSPVPSDIGRNIIQGGTVRGVLLAYDTLAAAGDFTAGDTTYDDLTETFKHPRRWCINRTGTMLANTATTISGGTGSGYTLVNNHQFKAPTATDNVWQNINADKSFSFLIGLGITLDATFNTHLDGFACDSNRRAGVSTGDNLAIGATISNGSSSRGTYGLIAQAPSKLTVSNCSFYENRISAIRVEDVANSLSDTTNYFTISSCKLYRNGKAHTSTGDAAIGGQFNYALIANNQIFENYYTGINIVGNKNRIIGNLIADNGWSDTVGPSYAASGIYLEVARNNIIHSNWIGNRLATNYQGVGVHLGANAHDNVIQDNYIVGDTSGGIRDVDGGLRNQNFDNQVSADASTLKNGTGMTVRTNSATAYFFTAATTNTAPALNVTSTNASVGGYSMKVNTSAVEPYSPALGVFNRDPDFSTDLVLIKDSAATGAMNTVNGSFLSIRRKGDTGSAYVMRVQRDSMTLGDTAYIKVKVPYLRGTGSRLVQASAAGDLSASMPAIDTGTFTCSYVGYSSNLTRTCRYSKAGTSVTLTLDSALGTSTQTYLKVAGLPTAIQTTRVGQAQPLATAQDNGVVGLGVAVTRVTGDTLDIAYKGAATGDFTTVFTGSGAKGLLRPTTITYQTK